MLETDADRLESIKALGGQLVRSQSGEFWAIFENEYRAITVGDLEVESRGPALTCRTSDIQSLAKDEAFRVSDADYRLRRREPDNPAPGWTTLLLRA